MTMLGSPGNKTESEDVIRAWTAVYLTLSGLSFLLNATFLTVVWKNWKQVKRRRITYHLTNLAISDSVIGASTLAYYVDEVINSNSSTPQRSVFVTIAWTAILTSLLAVCMMAIERAVCIRRPHTWKQILPIQKISIVMIANWVLTLSLSIFMHFFTLAMRFVLLVLFYVTILVTSVVYLNVYRDIWKVTATEGNANQDLRCPSGIREKKNRLAQRKVGSFVLILTPVLLVIVSPSFLTLAVKMACELFELNCTFIEIVNMLTHYFYMLEITNFVVNPILYVWRMSTYRNAFWQMFCKKSDARFNASMSSQKNDVARAWQSQPTKERENLMCILTLLLPFHLPPQKKQLKTKRYWPRNTWPNNTALPQVPVWEPYKFCSLIVLNDNPKL